MGTKMKVYLRPLGFSREDDPAWDPQRCTAKDVLEFASTPYEANTPADFATRLADLPPDIFAVPSEPHVLSHLVWPLRHARASYGFGNFLGTIALCGMVAEIIAITYFEGTRFALNNTIMDEKAQAHVWGRPFEKLGQDRRLQVLRAYGVISDDTHKSLEHVRVIRNQYLHWSSHSHDTIREDAKSVFIATSEQMEKLMTSGFDEGSLVLTPVMLTVLRDKGFL